MKVSHFNSFMQIKFPFERFKGWRRKGWGQETEISSLAHITLDLSFDGF